MKPPAVLMVIPARAGSKGVPGKNVRCVGGRPLVAWAMLQAHSEGAAFKGGYHVVVSTNDPQVEVLAEEYGTQVISRPPHLCDDTAMTDPVLVHALHEVRKNGALPNPDVVVLLQPTSPLRQPDVIQRCVRRTQDYDCTSVFTAHRAHFVWTERFDGTDWKLECNAPRRPRRQAFVREEERWLENGNCYAVRAAELLSSQRRLTGNVRMIEVPLPYGFEVDDEEDMRLLNAAFEWTETVLTYRPEGGKR